MIPRQTKLTDTDELYHKQTALCYLIVFFITLSCDRDPQLQVAKMTRMFNQHLFFSNLTINDPIFYIEALSFYVLIRLINPFSAGSTLDVRIWRLKTVSALKQLKKYNDRRSIT